MTNPTLTTGKKYDGARDIKEIAKLVRKDLKRDVPEFKFAVRISRYSMGQSLRVEPLSGPFPLLAQLDEDGIASDGQDQAGLLRFVVEFRLGSGLTVLVHQVVQLDAGQGLLELVDHRLSLSALFENRIYTLVDVGYRSKPNPDIFLYAAQQLRSFPENCVVIEDAPHGIDAARRAGMRCIAISTTYDCEKLQNADVVVNSYSEIDLEAVDKHTSL